MTHHPYSFSQAQSFPISMRSRQATMAGGTANWFRVIGKQRDLVVVAAFCAIGLAVSLAVFARLPDFATAIAAMNLTP
jgi:hypothetical protein